MRYVERDAVLIKIICALSVKLMTVNHFLHTCLEEIPDYK
jgi:hypothetical protein